jgi:Flp pilus assembly protein TadG
MGIRIRRLSRRDGGQALVELSLCAGFLCLMLLAVWQVGSIFSNYIDISEAARSGARAAALSGAPTTTNDAPSLAAAKTEGQFAATNSASVPGMVVTIAPVGNWTAGGKVRATVTAPYTLSLFGVAVSSGTMSVTDDMRVHRMGA